MTRRHHRPTAIRLGVAAGLATMTLTLVALPAAADPSPAPAPAPAPAPSPAPTPGQPPHPGPSAPSPAPTKPTSTSPSTPPAAPGLDDPSWYDPEALIRHAIASFLGWVAAQALNPTLDALGQTVLATPDLSSDERVQDIWTGSLVVTNTALVLLVVVGGFMIIGRENLQARAGLKEIAPRIAVAAITANLSLLVIGKAIVFTNAVTAGIAHRGVNTKAAAKAIQQTIEAHLSGDDVMASLLIIAMNVMAMVVVATFVLRIMLMVGLIGVAPLALACHAFPQTEQVAYTWWRSLAACLAIQVGQAVVLVAALRVFLTPTDGLLPGYYTDKGLLGLLLHRRDAGPVRHDRPPHCGVLGRGRHVDPSGPRS